MKRGRVVPRAASAWSNGHLRATEYFAGARQRARANAIKAVRTELRLNGSSRLHRSA